MSVKTTQNENRNCTTEVQKEPDDMLKFLAEYDLNCAYNLGYQEGYKDGKEDAVIHAHYENSQCTHCGAEAPTDSRLDFIEESDISYCWNCGAKMDGVK